tara:strand:- start:82 stop:186 length:105 start_codon:yes stop_codon:yes gene_type:complete
MLPVAGWFLKTLSSILYPKKMKNKPIKFDLKHEK